MNFRIKYVKTFKFIKGIEVMKMFGELKWNDADIAEYK